MSYIDPDISRIEWDNLTGWIDGDTNGAVSQIDPGGQLSYDLRGATSGATAARWKDIGTIGSGDYYCEIRFIGNPWDGRDVNYRGIRVLIDAGTQRLYIHIANDRSAAGDGIWVNDGASDVKVLTKTWDNNWHTIVLFIHNNQTDCDIWVDKDPETESADVTDADCSDETVEADGFVALYGEGSPDGNGEYHIGFTYLGSTLKPGETNWHSPTANGAHNNEWPSPTNVYYSDDVSSAPQGDKAHSFESFEDAGFDLIDDLPTNVRIDGIEVSIEAKADVGDGGGISIQLNANSDSKNNTWPGDGVEYTKTYGGSTDKWGRAWTRSDFTNDTFWLYAYSQNTGQNYIDHIQVKVYYTEYLIGNKSVNGILKTNIKSINSISVANLKTVN